MTPLRSLRSVTRLGPFALMLGVSSCLGKMAEEGRTDQAVHDVYNGDTAVRERAIGLIAKEKWRSPRAIDALKQATRDSEPLIRADAIRALASLEVGADTMRGILTRALGDTALGVRYAALEVVALDPYNDPFYLTALTSALRDSSSDIVRAAAAVAIGRLGDAGKPALADLRRAMNDTNASVQHEARDAFDLIYHTHRHRDP